MGTDLWMASVVNLLHAGHECAGVSTDIQNKKVVAFVCHKQLTRHLAPGPPPAARCSKRHKLHNRQAKVKQTYKYAKRASDTWQPVTTKARVTNDVDVGAKAGEADLEAVAWSKPAGL